MASDFKHLEHLPLDEENLIINDNPESNLKSKSCLNLGFIAINSAARFIDILERNKVSLTNTNTFLDLTYILEGILINTININSISNISNTELTSHYKKRQININSNKILPSFGYCQNLTFTGFKTWAGFYGTLSYYINLLEDYEEYLTPSEIIYYASNKLLEYSRSTAYNAFLNKNDINYKLLNDFYLEAETLINNDSIESDKNIYNLSINIILTSSFIKEIYTELNFLEEWLPKIYLWKSSIDNQNVKIQIEENPTTNIQKAINTLLIIINGLNSEGFNILENRNLASSFIRQTYPKNINNILNIIAQERLNTTYINLDNETKSEAELLVIDFLKNISKFRVAYDFNKACNIIQETFAPPGGYALFLITLANILFNRAYILSYENINNKKELITNSIYKRIIKLIGYGSILLIKSNIPQAEIIATNILKSFKLYLTNIDSNNLLDIY